MLLATQDPVGVNGVVVRLHDDGLEVRTDERGTLRLRHHDMAGHGDALGPTGGCSCSCAGYLGTRVGSSVVTAGHWEPCRPRLR